MRRTIIRQGDVLLIEEGIPKNAKIRAHTLAIRGETGNEHKMEKVNLYSKGVTVLVEVTAPSQLRHPQHPALAVPVGSYRVARVRDRDIADSLFMPVQSPIAARTYPGD